MDNIGKPATPWHLWAIGVVSLLWNAGGGGLDYVMVKTANADYMQAAADTMDMDVAVVADYFADFPGWMNVFWAIGVWAAVAGSLMLLFRSRYAAHAFVASLVGIVVSGYYQFANPFPGEVDSTIPTIMAVVVPVITVLLIYYAHRMTKRGVLR